MSKWEENSLAEVCEKVVSGGTPNTKKIEYYYNGDICWLKTKEVLNNSIYSTEDKITAEGLKNSSAKLLPVDSVIIAMYGDGKTAGRVAINKIPLATNQACCNLILNSEKAYYKYIFYNLLGRYDELVQLKLGGSQQNLNSNTIKNMKVLLPPLPTQRKIADILSAYDDLIENNNRRIKLLEKAAQNLYKEWFVRFRFPNHKQTKFENGLPQGWEVVKLGGICQTVGGGTPSTTMEAYWINGDIMWVTPTDITKNNCIVLTHVEKKITKLGLNKSSAKLLPPNSILMTSRATIGYFGLIDKEVCTNQGFISIIPNQDYSRMYILYNLIHRSEEIISKASGATFKEISKSTFRKFNILLPDEDTLKKFNEIVIIQLELIRKLKLQNRNLIKQRDLLLPRLMSGKLEV